MEHYLEGLTLKSTLDQNTTKIVLFSPEGLWHLRAYDQKKFRLLRQTLCVARWSIRSKSIGNGFIVDGTLHHRYEHLLKSYTHIQCAMRLCQLLLVSQPIGVAAPELYRALQLHLAWMETTSYPQQLIASFCIKLLIHEGQWPPETWIQQKQIKQLLKLGEQRTRTTILEDPLTEKNIEQLFVKTCDHFKRT